MPSFEELFILLPYHYTLLYFQPSLLYKPSFKTGRDRQSLDRWISVKFLQNFETGGVQSIIMPVWAKF